MNGQSDLRVNRIGDTLVHFGGNQGLVNALCSQGVDYLVVGGLAVSWHCPARVADDMDLLLCPNAENSRRISRALSSIGLSGISDESFAKFAVRASLKGAEFYADLLTPQSIDPPYDVTALDAEEASLFGCRVRVASVRAMIALKRCALESGSTDPAKHIHDIRLLEAALADRQ